VRAAAEGCAAIVHAAALVKLWCKDRRAYDAVNVTGTLTVAECARERQARFVHVSSFMALGPSDGGVLDEAGLGERGEFHNDYERSKYAADRAVRALDPASLHVVRLYPGVVYGPGPLTEGNHVVRLLLEHARGTLPGMLGKGDRRQCFAFVDDVVAGVLAALDRAPSGSGYVLGGENRTGVELFDAFARASGVPPPRRRVPYAAATLVGLVQRWRAELFGIEPQLTDEVVGVYRHEWAYSSARAERELGYRVTPLEEGLRRTVRWLREIGELPAAGAAR
jgi:farnesol dehydrogenase